jgi:hypothetical protein
VGEAELIGDELIEACFDCHGTTSSTVAEVIEGDRVVWIISSRCEGCGRADELREWAVAFDDGDDVRQALIARVGLARLHADPDDSRAVRLKLLAVFRRRGATLVEAAEAYADLTGPGLTGTPAEMMVLSDQLTAVGASVSLRPDRTDSR